MLLDVGAQIDVKDKSGESPLSHACRQGHPEVVELLLKKGAKVSETNNRGGWTPLLLAAGRDYDFFCGVFLSPLEVKKREMKIEAVDKEQVKIVKLLLDKGADVNAKNWDNRTPLVLAAKKGYTQVVKLLLNSGADVSLKDQLGWVALDYAKENNHKEIVELLKDRIARSKPKGRQATKTPK